MKLQTTLSSAALLLLLAVMVVQAIDPAYIQNVREAAVRGRTAGYAMYQDEDDGGLRIPSPFASTSYVFPSSPEKRFPSGEHIEILVGFRNNGEESLNITSVEASFNHPLDHRHYIQNFTRGHYGLVVRPASEASFSYVIRPDVMLEPKPMDLVVSVHYHDERHVNWTTVVFNSTIEMVDAGTAVDAETFFILLLVAAGAGLLLFVVSRVLPSFRKSGGRTKVERGTKKGAGQDQVDQEWLKGTAADPSFQQRKKSSGGAKKNQ
ncbi:hypothetical protein QOT17_004327 [Balamuthia mandrillaris]